MQRTHGSFGEHAAVPLAHTVAHSPSYSYPPTPHDWTRIQGAVYDYYVSQNLPLHDVRNKLQKHHGFKASDRMIKARLAKWEYSKNAKKEDWGYLAILLDQRKREKKPTLFAVRGHRKTVKDLHRFIRNQGTTPDQFLAEWLGIFEDKGRQFPKHIRAYTPDSDDILQSPLTEESCLHETSPAAYSATLKQEALPDSSPRLFAASSNPLYYQDPAASRRDNLEHKCPYQSYATEPNRFSTNLAHARNMSSKSGSPHSLDNLELYSCEKTRVELEACSSQLLKPVPLKSRIGHNDMRCWSIINCVVSTPSADAMDITEHHDGCDHTSPIVFPSLELFEPKRQQRNILNDTGSHALDLPSSMRNEGSWVWVSLCFLACMSLTRGDEDFAQGVLNEAKKKFAKLLQAQDPLLLTAAGLMITILHQHDQGKISIRVLNSAKEVVQEMIRDPDDPIRKTITYLALTADGPGTLLREAGLLPIHLKMVYEKLRAKYGVQHPYTIAAHHNYAWFLKWNGEPVEGEKHAREAYKQAKACFGVMHMQTMTSLSVTTGCIVQQKDPGRNQECVQLYREIIDNATQILGVIHPYTLEAQRRLASILEEMPGQMGVAIKLHRTIVFGKATMLGRSHPFTISHKEDYIRLLQKHQRWYDEFGKPSKEQQEMIDMFTKDLEEAWELVEEPDEVLEKARNPRSVETEEQEDEWSRSAMCNILSRSRSVSPTISNDYEAY